MKSNVSDLLEVVTSVYIDACTKCIADVSDLRDLETMRSRVEREGLSFLTITLPNFAKDFERSLAVGFVDSSLFRAFKKPVFRASDGTLKKQAIPGFLQGMLSQLFNRETGGLHDNTANSFDAPTIVECIRQICLVFKKVELDCTLTRVRSAISEFVSIEHDLSVFSVSEEDTSEFRSVSSLLWDNLIFGICLDECNPHHGPGTTADGISGNGKFRWRSWNGRLEPYFPLIDSAFSESAFGSEELESVNVLSEDKELPVKVTPVPKTLKGPRIIAIEPCCMQYTQQGIRNVLYERIENYWMTRGHVNFRDQGVNQRLALIASSTGQLATIDLSEASDRVPRDLALSMFESNPDLRDAIEACRSTHAKLPDGTIIGPLNKFASMGSALCFPVESMYFYTICVAALLAEQGLPVSHENIFNVSRDVYVYGDDIIVPNKHANAVLVYLQKYNCKVNQSKTFLSGSFRESCGVDAFAGMEVTPTYLRKDVPQNRRQADRLVSWVKTGNLFYLKGYWKTSSTIFKIVERILGSLPYVAENSGHLGRVSFLGYVSAERWNRRYQCLEIRAWVPEPVYRTDRLNGYAALQKSLSKLTDLSDLWSARDASHLERSARYGVVALKRRWVLIS
ncbi:TPA_asm: RNA-directed RNA polymerase [ssRNA phage ESO000]|uniref:RNA-directed RNA polymerase n=1 Tax=ssRNA phage ESO000 TaxID=2786007 RepID=A0A8S5KX81_9VIRU|nr:RNA-directed RNA polymerase [ssRNA phage ESO000]DAD49918.1 TPA_asm: RNA-directed RNA polymerase [ssRNA phage ESO000]